MSRMDDDEFQELLDAADRKRELDAEDWIEGQQLGEL